MYYNPKYNPNYLFIKLSENACLKQIPNGYLLESSCFDSITDFKNPITNIIEYFAKINQPNNPSSIEAISILQQKETPIKLIQFLKTNTLVLLVNIDPTTKNKFSTAFYLKKFIIEDHNIKYYLEHFQNLENNLIQQLNLNWSFNLNQSTLFIDRTNNTKKLHSYNKTPSHLLKQ